MQGTNRVSRADRRVDPSATALELAIVQTAAYSDIFDYPLSAAEIHRYLIEVTATRDAVDAALAGGCLAPGGLASCNEYFSLAGREPIVSTRQQRAHDSERLWREALRYGRIIASLPYVRMVAVTGELAMDNVQPASDIDYFIVTRPGRLWLCRLLVIGVVRIAAVRGITVCPNYLLSEDALAIHERNLYAAHEVAQMVPIAGHTIYQRLREVNSWVDTYLPNAGGAPKQLMVQPRATPLRRLAERVLDTRAGAMVERWEMQRKLRKLSKTAGHVAEASFGPDWCKGHVSGHERRILAAYDDRRRALEEGDYMSEVLLGQSYYLRFDPKLWEAMQPYPPLGTLYAASYIRERGYDVALFDAMLAESEAEWQQALQREQPRFAVLFEDNFNYLSKMCLLRMRDAAFTMIMMAREQGCTVIAAGADASDHGAAYLDAGADYVLFGEGDATLAELLDHLTGRGADSLSEIKGLTYRDPEQGVIQTQRRPDLKDLDALPFPAWDLVDIPRYQTVWRQHHGYYSMNMVTTRGCPFHCNWCAKPIWGQRYNARSPENVAQELKWLKERFQPDHIWFVDDIMGLKPGWLERFADLVEEYDARVPFKRLNRVDLLLRGDAIRALKRAGAKTVWVGAESGSQKILDAMEKGTRVEQIYETASKLHAAGIEVGFFLQFGYPGETRADIEMTLQMVRDCRPDDIGMSVSYPLPGTKFHDWVRDQLGVKQNWLDSNDLAMLYKGTYSTDFYRQLHRVLHKEFRARKNRELLKRTLRQPRQARPHHLRQAAAMTAQIASLPIERRKLDQLERQPQRGITQIPLVLDPTAAARPSAQSEGEQSR